MATPLGGTALKRLKCGFFIVCLYPVWRWFYLAWTDNLTANPPEFLIRSSGVWCLVLLFLSLSITPLRHLTGQSALIRLRRMAGLFSLFYGLLHTVAWSLWEQDLSLLLMWQDLIQRPFVTVGAVALLFMLLLGITSTHGWMRRLGRNWQRLHRLVYLAAILALLHFYLMRLGKNNFLDVWIYSAVLAVLFGMRIWWRWQRHASAQRE
ncbi:sulfite oxidase heme-binding subunit YedZ [Alcaligenes endophyticus]|uniref:Protein-methionine-sulfoxide reductase heme-binding subunit MsrQ n=1 Tax=Alcaligenes endophyticus TaxID=1929088 RepID=A0ABT8EHQ0_9BURK|nr:protein-methionine-sulfoxide reductase heme-binding subunit MsrQ [Alcaligenes endophyticus]MCX5592163.1 sulfoxide reductase heme-binding subunit YedZ [Alcaligenes endophyticus]MDN4120810.1 sulfoxide reductase heme-binding subunit YedZ [Alcaligenes endophyticus]